MVAGKRRGNHLVTTRVEHPAILETCKYLESQGMDITYLPVDSFGRISLDDLEMAVNEKTVLVSIMYTNNEIGSVMPILEASKIIKKKNPNTLFHVDAVQGYGKYKIYPKKMGIDLLSVSGHKIHAPKGIGFLYISEKVKMLPLINGGGQQKNLRSGTENVCGIVGIGVACEKIFQTFDEDNARMKELRRMMINELSSLDGISINGADEEHSAPHIVSVSVEKIRAEVLLHSLEEKGVYVSSGSACASNKPAISATLQAIGVKKELLDSTIRFSFCVNTTKEEIDYAVNCLKDTLTLLRKYVRR